MALRPPWPDGQTPGSASRTPPCAAGTSGTIPFPERVPSAAKGHAPRGELEHEISAVDLRTGIRAMVVRPRVVLPMTNARFCAFSTAAGSRPRCRYRGRPARSDPCFQTGFAPVFTGAFNREQRPGQNNCSSRWRWMRCPAAPQTRIQAVSRQRPVLPAPVTGTISREISGPAMRRSDSERRRRGRIPSANTQAVSDAQEAFASGVLRVSMSTARR